MANYAHITRNTNPDFASGGYKNEVYIAPKADFLVLQSTITPVVNLGDASTISAAHTFTAPKGFYKYACKVHSVAGKSSTIGDEGAQEEEFTYEFIIIGDSAANQEQLQRLLNDDVIIIFKDAECGANQFLQLGNDCVSPTFSKEFDSKTTKEGKKENKVTVKCKKRFFYNYTVTQAA